MEEKGKKKFVTADELLVEIVMDQLDEICENHDKVGLFVDKSDFFGIEECCEEDAMFSAEHYLDEDIFQSIQNGENVEIDDETYDSIVEEWCEFILELDDADFKYGYFIKNIENKFGDNKFALVLRKGYSFDNLQTEFWGLFDSIEEAENYMKESGKILKC
jgi:hypothetical protein